MYSYEKTLQLMDKRTNTFSNSCIGIFYAPQLYKRTSRFFSKQSLIRLHYSNILMKLFFTSINFVIVECLDRFLFELKPAPFFRSDVFTYLPVSWSKRFFMNFFINFPENPYAQRFGQLISSKSCSFYTYKERSLYQLAISSCNVDNFFDFDTKHYSVLVVKEQFFFTVYKIGELNSRLVLLKKGLMNHSANAAALLVAISGLKTILNNRFIPKNR